MNKYIISYVSNSGLTVLNAVVEASSRVEAIQDIKGSEGVSMILSVVCIK